MWRRKKPYPSAEAEESLWQAERALVDAERRDDCVREVAEKLKQTRHRNNFGAAVIESFRRTR